MQPRDKAFVRRLTCFRNGALATVRYRKARGPGERPRATNLGLAGPLPLAALAFVLQRLADFLEFRQRSLVDAGKVQIEPLQRTYDRRADHDAGKPFMVGRNHMPWRERRGRMPHNILIDGQITRPPT